MADQNANKLDINTKVAMHEKEIQASLDRLEIKSTIVINFPQYNILPRELELALIILKKNEAKFMLSYEEVKK